MIGVNVCNKCGAVRRDAPPSGTMELARFLIGIVSEVTGVSVQAIKSKGQAPHEMIARAAACSIIRDPAFGDLKWKDVGMAIGGRGHSTAMNMRRHFENSYVIEVLKETKKAFRIARRA